VIQLLVVSCLTTRIVCANGSLSILIFPNIAKNMISELALTRRPRGLVTEIVDALASSIRSGDIKPGDKLPTEAAIMTHFDVSRTVVREAISKLQASNLVTTRHGIGTFALEQIDPKTFQISPVDFATVNDVISVLELRISLETESAGLAAKRRTSDNLRAMHEALDTFETSIKGESDAAPSDFQFHLEIAKATGNRHFAELMTYLGEKIIPRTRVNTSARAMVDKASYLRRVNTEHQNILGAIRTQNADAARAAMRLHLSNSLERLRRSQEL
jgi:GntR family transcriptional regulator, transcriptional repressor for pyruvate dehydrogenase complex